MKCHYEVLDLPMEATDDDVKRSYRRLALKWHPDKNRENADEAKAQFQLIQQAYEVLSDPQERAWYDRHRDEILSKSQYENYRDDRLNVYQYFNTSCFKGYGDDEGGFYSVYKDVFSKIAAEDAEFESEGESDSEVPSFGKSDSPYAEVVHPFYSFWMSYSTKKTYSWLDKYDIREAPNRRVLRLMEKENKKIRDKARKERNDEIRALVAFVRKRDKRVQKHAEELEIKAKENEKKAEEKRREQIRKRQEEIKSYVESDWSKFSNLETELNEIEAHLAAEFQDSDKEECSDEDQPNSLYCSVCNKMFKTEGAFVNHENSKRHQEALALLDSPEDEESDQNAEAPHEDTTEPDKISEVSKEDASVDELSDPSLEDDLPVGKKKKKKNKPQPKPTADDSEQEDVDLDSFQGKRNKNKYKEPSETENNSKSRKTNTKKKSKEIPPPLPSEDDLLNKNFQEAPAQTVEAPSSRLQQKPGPKVNPKKLDSDKSCVKCKSTFKSKNELFKHLKSTGHSVYIGQETVSKEIDSSKGSKKNRRNK